MKDRDGSSPRIDTVDSLNCALVVVAAILAWWAPFATFIIAYVVLGPLHYLTEISWLHDRRYFLQSGRDARVLIALCILGFLTSLVPHTGREFLGADLGFWCQRVAVLSVILAFALASALNSPRLRPHAVAVGVLAAVSILATSGGIADYPLFLVFGIFLPTLIHVSVFTLVFMVSGAARNSSVAGAVSVALYLVCLVLLVLIPSAPPSDGEAQVTRFGEAFLDSFGYLSSAVLSLFGMTFERPLELLEGREAVAVGRVLAFTYTYHYLNWFSKTSILGWHEITPARAGFIVSWWIGTLLVTLVSFPSGIMLGGLLSLLHVFLEFPLNWVSFGSVLTYSGRFLPARTRARPPRPC